MDNLGCSILWNIAVSNNILLENKKIKFSQKFSKNFSSLKQDEFFVLPLDLILKFWKKFCSDRRFGLKKREWHPGSKK